MPMGRSKAPPARAISRASRAVGPDQGGWRLMISRDLLISRASEAHQTVGLLRRLMQLAKPRQLPGGLQVGAAGCITLGFLGVENAAAQGGGNAHHAVESLGADEVAPFAGQIQLILGADHVARGSVHAVLREKQPDDLVPASQYRLGEAQGSARGGRVGRGKQV